MEMKKLILPLLLLYSFFLLSQKEEDGLQLGNFPIENYGQKQYSAHHQNWFITQDQTGFIYAANGEGILEYDGASWRLIAFPGLRAVRTVVVDRNNVKWIGGDRELGYLVPDTLGMLKYRSLKDKIPETYPLTANIWQIFPEGDRIIFASDNTLYSYKNDQFTVIPHPGDGSIYREYQVHGKVYVSIIGEGMFVVNGEKLELIPNGEFFKNIRATVALPFGQDSVLFVSKGAGMYLYSGSTITKMSNEIEAYLDDNLLYAGQRLTNTKYAFATLRGGVVLMDNNGKYLGHITEQNGIANNQVHALTVDREGALWLAHQTGISKVSLQLPYTYFDSRNGLDGTVSCILRHEGKLYVGTYSGLYVLDKDMESDYPKFRKIQGITSGCFNLLSKEGELFAASANGVFLISEEGVQQVSNLLGCRTLGFSKLYPDRIFVGHLHGLASIKYNDGEWTEVQDLGQINDDIFSITPDAKGGLWLGTSLNPILKVEFPDSEKTNSEFQIENLLVERYTQGLPKGSTNVWSLGEELFVTTDVLDEPLYRLDPISKQFNPEKEFGKKFGLDSLNVFPRAYQSKGQYILLESKPVQGKVYRFTAYKNGNGEYNVQRFYDEAIRSTTETHLFWEGENQIWSGGEGIYKYDFNTNYDFKDSFNTYVRKVIVGSDSIIYGGDPSIHPNTVLNHSNFGIRFEFASLTSHPEANNYQYNLLGFDEKWSEWSHENRKDYTNLPEGEYSFMVRARNIYGDIGQVGTFNFVILPPWYRAWWAYVIYVVLFLGFLWIILQLRSRQLRIRNEALEKLIEIRTTEVQHQANQLKIQAEKLLDLDKAKSRFFANISHEFRTPLTLIKGPIEQLEQNFDQKLSMETVIMIRRNANRLLNMVNQLLDLSKIDEGNLKLSPSEGDVFKCLRTAVSSFNSHAAQRRIDYRVRIPTNMLWASFDRDKLENIVYNLLGNAFKFSENGSEISFEADYYSNNLRIQVSDTGLGIPKERLPFIFDRFYQVDNSATKEKEGSGIGLSLSKDLIDLMGGTISVSSVENKGTFFTVLIPLQEIKTRSIKVELVKNSKEMHPTIANVYELNPGDYRDLPRILLIEDNSDMRQFIKGQLIGTYRVIEAVNGEAGLQCALKDPPDLIVTDLMMPRMDGIELCRKLKTDLHTSHIPVIMLTAKAGRENKIEGLEIGADDYLTKPFDGKELLVRIRNLIEQRKYLRELFSNKDIGIDPKKVTVTSVDQKFLEEVLALLEDKFSEPDFGVVEMQVALAMSKTQLHRKIKALTNESPGELLRNFRLKRAAQLLRQKVDNVTQIAYMVGFNNLSYFAKCFKRLYGVPPSDY